MILVIAPTFPCRFPLFITALQILNGIYLIELNPCFLKNWPIGQFWLCTFSFSLHISLSCTQTCTTPIPSFYTMISMLSVQSLHTKTAHAVHTAFQVSCGSKWTEAVRWLAWLQTVLSSATQRVSDSMDGWHITPTPKTVPWWMAPIMAMTFLFVTHSFSSIPFIDFMLVCLPFCLFHPLTFRDPLCWYLLISLYLSHRGPFENPETHFQSPDVVLWQLASGKLMGGLCFCCFASDSYLLLMWGESSSKSRAQF